MTSKIKQQNDSIVKKNIPQKQSQSSKGIVNPFGAQIVIEAKTTKVNSLKHVTQQVLELLDTTGNSDEKKTIVKELFLLLRDVQKNPMKINEEKHRILLDRLQSKEINCNEFLTNLSKITEHTNYLGMHINRQKISDRPSLDSFLKNEKMDDFSGTDFTKSSLNLMNAIVEHLHSDAKIQVHMAYDNKTHNSLSHLNGYKNAYDNKLDVIEKSSKSPAEKIQDKVKLLKLSRQLFLNLAIKVQQEINKNADVSIDDLKNLSEFKDYNSEFGDELYKILNGLIKIGQGNKKTFDMPRDFYNFPNSNEVKYTQYFFEMVQDFKADYTEKEKKLQQEIIDHARIVSEKISSSGYSLASNTLGTVARAGEAIIEYTAAAGHAAVSAFSQSMETENYSFSDSAKSLGVELLSDSASQSAEILSLAGEKSLEQSVEGLSNTYDSLLDFMTTSATSTKEYTHLIMAQVDLFDGGGEAIRAGRETLGVIEAGPIRFNFTGPPFVSIDSIPILRDIPGLDQRLNKGELTESSFATKTVKYAVKAQMRGQSELLEEQIKLNVTNYTKQILKNNFIGLEQSPKDIQPLDQIHENHLVTLNKIQTKYQEDLKRIQLDNDSTPLSKLSNKSRALNKNKENIRKFAIIAQKIADKYNPIDKFYQLEFKPNKSSQELQLLNDLKSLNDYFGENSSEIFLTLLSLANKAGEEKEVRKIDVGGTFEESKFPFSNKLINFLNHYESKIYEEKLSLVDDIMPSLSEAGKRLQDATSKLQKSSIEFASSIGSSLYSVLKTSAYVADNVFMGGLFSYYVGGNMLNSGKETLTASSNAIEKGLVFGGDIGSVAGISSEIISCLFELIEIRNLMNNIVDNGFNGLGQFTFAGYSINFDEKPFFSYRGVPLIQDKSIILEAIERRDTSSIHSQINSTLKPVADEIVSNMAANKTNVMIASSKAAGQLIHVGLSDAGNSIYQSTCHFIGSKFTSS